MNILNNIDKRLLEASNHTKSSKDISKERITKLVLKSIMNGNSNLKKHIENGEITIKDVIRSIKNQRCLRTSEHDLGHTYLEQIIGSAIRDVIPLQYINQVRELFNLDKLPPSELKPQKSNKDKSQN